MLINGMSPEKYNAKQWRVTIGPSALKNSTTWEEGATAPFFQTPFVGAKTIKVVMMVKGNSREEISMNCDGIVRECLAESVILKLDGYDETEFIVSITKYSIDEKSIGKWSLLTLEFTGITCSEVKTVVFDTRNSTMIEGAITNNWITCPCEIKISKIPVDTNYREITIHINGFGYKENKVVINNGIYGQDTVIINQDGVRYGAGNVIPSNTINKLPALFNGENGIFIYDEEYREKYEVEIKYREIYP